MIHSTRAAAALIILGVLSVVAAACGTHKTSSPAGPSTSPTAPAPPPAPGPNLNDPVAFRDPSGFSTTDVRDAHDHIVQFTVGGDLVWAADGTRIPGYFVTGDSAYFGPPTYFIGGQICQEGCVFSIRFGAADGERRAYLTVDYGHDNPGTLVDVAVVSGALVVSQTSLFPPGAPTLSGVVTEMTAAGPVPVAGASVSRGVPAGYQRAVTDENGFYTIPGLPEGTDVVYASKPGYRSTSTELTLKGDRQFDIALTRQ